MDDLGRGWEHQRAGRYSDADACYRRFLAGHPEHAEAWAALGVVAFKRQNLDEAIDAYVRSLALKPGSAQVLTNLGVAYALKRDFAAAERSFRQAIAIQPASLEAYRNLGHALRDQSQFAKAIPVYQQARMLNPNDIDILGSLGSAFYKANRAVEGIEPLVTAVRLVPRAVHLHQLLGTVLAAAERFDEAEAAFRKALTLDSTDAGSHNGLGIVEAQRKRFAAAESAFREAIRLNPDIVEAHQNLGNVCRDQDRYDEALACYATAIDLRLDAVEAHNNAGIALGRMGRHEDSIRAYDRALAFNPEHPEARKNRAMIRLLLGDYEKGFAEFEARWDCRDFVRPSFTQPVWKGESIAGKTILLIPEQGLGDTIQFIRFASKVKAEGATVVFVCPRPLLKLCGNVPGVDVVIPNGGPLPFFDVYVPLVSLPAVFRTSLEDIPGVQPVPYLRADPELVELWRDRLGPRAPGELCVGIFWRGNPANSHDRFRSAPLEALVPLAAVPGVTLISIQKGHGVEEIGPLADRLPMLDFRESTRFEDTAALMTLLDVMITIDSAPAHLAGALGVPTWLALSKSADWRWLVGREDCPWYPSARIFRQSELHRWEDVFQRMAGALAELAARERNGKLEAHRNLGHALRDQGKFAEAAQVYQEARMLNPKDVDVLSGLATALFQANQPAAAIDPLVELLGLMPGSVRVHRQLGIALAGADRLDEAEAVFRRALSLDPADARVQNALGILYAKRMRFAEAEACSRTAVLLEPDLVEAHQNLGDILFAQERDAEALASYGSAIKLRPDLANVHTTIGVILGRLGRCDESILAFNRAVALDPDYAEPRYNRAMTKLRLGDYRAGFAEYEWRWKCNGFVRPGFVQPLWKGESIAGKTILLIPEQGLGDTFQFIRFAPKVKRTGARVLFLTRRSLLELLANAPGIDALIPDDEPWPEFDVYAPLMNLPAIFGTCLEDVPGVHPVPYLEADPNLVERWRDRLGPRAPGELRVGIFWQGNPAHRGDRFRSAPLEAFLPLAAVSGVKLISFQKGHGVEQIARLADRLPLFDFGDELDRDSGAFQDTAALMSLLDVMITVDSAPVHLAGALGVPTWLALSTCAEWRWLLDREDSPWYPTVRIFRQAKLHDWNEVFERMARALAELAAHAALSRSANESRSRR